MLFAVPLFVFVSAAAACATVRAVRVNTLPFPGRIMDCEWLSCREVESWRLASALLYGVMLKESEEASCCMLFTEMEAQRQMIGLELDQTNEVECG